MVRTENINEKGGGLCKRLRNWIENLIMKYRKHEYIKKFKLIWKIIEHKMEKKDIIINKICKKLANLGNKVAPLLAWAR